MRIGKCPRKGAALKIKGYTVKFAIIDVIRNAERFATDVNDLAYLAANQPKLAIISEDLAKDITWLKTALERFTVFIVPKYVAINAETVQALRWLMKAKRYVDIGIVSAAVRILGKNRIGEEEVKGKEIITVDLANPYRIVLFLTACFRDQIKELNRTHLLFN